MSEMNSASFVMYESFYKQAQILEKKLGKDTAYDFLNAVMEFGLYGVVPDEDDDVWMYGFEQTITSIDKAKDRYNKAVENGKKGGRPKKYDDQLILELKKQGLSNSQIAVRLGCSTRTVERAIAEITGRESDKTDKRGQNLNDNVNDNVNVKSVSYDASVISSGSAGTASSAAEFRRQYFK